MAILSLSLLGSFRGSLDEEPLVAFRTQKVQALLIYLAVENRSAHRRESLMTMLWPGLPERSAQINLRQILYHLRKIIPELSSRQAPAGEQVPFLIGDRHTLQINPQAACETDVQRFTSLINQIQAHAHPDLLDCPECLETLTQAAALYRGDFLADFYLDDSNEFEEWAAATRENLRGQALDILEILTDIHLGRKDFTQARLYAERQIQMDDLRESAYQQLMEILARSGQRSNALALYKTYSRLLARELGTEPAGKTAILYEKILSGELGGAADSTLDLHGYKLLEAVSAGPFSAVYRSYQPSVGREVAVKLILPPLASDPAFARSLETEILPVARLEHPYIAPLYDYWREAEKVYLVMRWFAGGNLQAALEKGPWQAGKAAQLLDQIASALTAIHRQGIIHRNIKPTNILLDEEGNAYLADCGIPKQAAVSGDLRYTSPEQIRNETLSPQTDVYSLGVVLYEALAGEKPFGEAASGDLAQTILEGSLPPLSARRPGLPPQVDEVLQRATAKKPAERYPDVLALAVALQQAILSGVISAGQAHASAYQAGLERPPSPEPAAQPEQASAASPYALLPAPSTSFIGRQAELKQLRSLLQDPACRLLSLTGPGGAGKTRLSIQLIEIVRDQFADGVYFVPLDSLNLGEPLAPAVAKALNFYFYQGEAPPHRQLLDYLQEKQILLVLDNFEQLISPENLGLVLKVITTARGVKILATSRSRLNVQGEQLFPVGGLETPETAGAGGDPEEFAQRFSALELFVERARRVRPNFQLTAGNLGEVIHICRLVQGAPLGIELAAAWLELLTTADIVAEIESNLDFLRTDLEGVPDRHRSLRVVFESSWKLLNDLERQTIQKLSVFQGAFSRQAAQQVSGAALQVLLRLANRSWLQQVNDGQFQLHAMLRQYANRLLQENWEAYLAARDAHSDFFSRFVEAQGRALRGSDQAAALDALSAEFNSNIRAALAWLIERRQFQAITAQMMPGLFHFCLIRNLGPDLIPLIQQARQALENETGRENQVSWAILATAETYIETRYKISENLPKEKLAKIWASVMEAGLAEDIGFWYVFLAREYTWEIAFEEGSRHFLEALPRIRARVASGEEDAWVLGCSLMFMGRLPLKQLGDGDRIRYLLEALEIFQKSGAIYEQALTLLLLGNGVRRKGGCFDECLQYYSTARELFEKAGDLFGVATIWRVLAEIYLLNGNYDQAFQAFKEQGEVYERVGNRYPPTGSGTFFGSQDLE